MRLTLLWGIAVGLLIAGVDLVAAETARRVTDRDLATGIEIIDLVANLAAFGWVAFRMAATAGEMRTGLETAVLAGIAAGLAGIVYQTVRASEPTTPDSVVALIAWNIVLSAVAGSLGAWVGSMRRTESPPR